MIKKKSFKKSFEIEKMNMGKKTNDLRGKFVTLFILVDSDFFGYNIFCLQSTEGKNLHFRKTKL